MSAPRSVPDEAPGAVVEAVARLGTGPLDEAALLRHVHPLFSRVLSAPHAAIYLANHSLGRPLDRTDADVREALALWYDDLETAWDGWLAEREAFRARIARLIGAPRPDCVVPRNSAAQGLRAVLNCFDTRIGVVTTSGEFNAVDLTLKVYAEHGRIALTRVPARDDGAWYADDLLAAADAGTRLIVVSLVFFLTSQVFADARGLIERAHARGIDVVLDLYHAAGVMPLDVEALDADFAIGGCYKYLRGGPGAGWLYLHPRHLDGAMQTLDTGWFAQSAPFAFERPPRPQLARGGNAFLENTPAVLPPYQARAGLELTLALGVERLRAYSLAQQTRLAHELDRAGVAVRAPGPSRGAFLTVPVRDGERALERVQREGVTADLRDGLLRLCPDILNTEEELAAAASRVARVLTQA